MENTKHVRNIDAEIGQLKSEAVILLNKLIDLKYEKVLSLSDVFTTQEINFGTKKNPKMHTVKLMHYKEKFKDEDTGKFVNIDRSRPVEVDGKMCNEWANEIKYYTVDNL